MLSDLFEFLFGLSEDVDMLVLLVCVQFGSSRLLLENRLLSIVFDGCDGHSFKKFVLEYSKSFLLYSAAVGLFLEEYLSMDSMRSIASIEASGIN